MSIETKLSKLERKAPQNVAPPEARASVERHWRAWLQVLFSHILSAPLASFHSEFWEWYWTALLAKRDGKPSPSGNAFFAVWSRGFGKSSHAEIAALAEAALVGKGLCLYVSGTQALANRHLASIEELLRSPDVAYYYPTLSEPKRGINNQSVGWRQEFLHLASGYAIIAIGLDVGVRGIRVGTARPSLIVLDDIDEGDDSPSLAQRKLEKLTRSILPTGGADTLIISAQNLIHRHGVINQIFESKVPALASRIVSGPHKAIDGLVTEQRGIREMIVAGRANWDYLGLTACQRFIDNSGLSAFLSEYQHDLSASETGRVIKEYDEAIHVIGWRDFARIFGCRYIPAHWEKAIGHDMGYTTGHLSAFTWLATSAMNSKLPGKRFRYRGLTFVDTLVDTMAEAIIDAMKPDHIAGRLYDERNSIQMWRMSHERKGERKTYTEKYRLPFRACKSGKTDGISQWRHYLRVDKREPHPFYQDELLPDGMYRLGCPSWFDVVDDDQIVSPRDDRGLKMHREQVLAWKMRPEKLTDAGLTREQPVKAFEDTCDATRMITAEWGPRATPLTEREELEKDLPDNIKTPNIPKLPVEDQWRAIQARDYMVWERKQAEEEEEAGYIGYFRPDKRADDEGDFDVGNGYGLG